MHEYIDDRNYINYGDDGERLTFIRRCPECSRFVKANESVSSGEMGLKDEPNATCTKHGAVKMPFLGYL